MPSVVEVYYLKYTIHEIYEQEIQVRDESIGVVANTKAPIFVKTPKEHNKSELIEALEQLEHQLLSLSSGNIIPGQGSILYPEYTVYEIYEQEIETEDRDVEIWLAEGKKYPFLVMSPKGLDKDRLSQALERLKAKLHQEID